jgi:hypothetical protein
VIHWNSSRRAKRLQWLADAEELRQAQRAARYAIRLRSGSYFVNVDSAGGTREQALRFENRSAADNYMRLFPWTLFVGAAVVDLRSAAPARGRR